MYVRVRVTDVVPTSLGSALPDCNAAESETAYGIAFRREGNACDASSRSGRRSGHSTVLLSVEPRRAVDAVRTFFSPVGTKELERERQRRVTPGA
jgi:hypothetical protein